MFSTSSNSNSGYSSSEADLSAESRSHYLSEKNFRKLTKQPPVDCKSSQNLSGFTLLELVIALTVILLLWGSILHINISIKKSFKELHAQTQAIKIKTQDFSRFEKDLNLSIKDFQGENSQITFQTVYGKISYKFEGKELYREEDQKSEKIDNQSTECSWTYYSKKQWLKTWNNNKPPQAILMEIKNNHEIFKMIFPIRSKE